MNPKQLSPNCKSEPSQAVESIMTVGKITIEIRNQMGKIQSFKYLHYQDNHHIYSEKIPHIIRITENTRLAHETL